MTGHSLGGKAALLAATMDPRVRATITLDPVDTSGFGCDPAECPDVSAMMPLDIPTAFLGETTDAAGGFQPCAPAADNSQTFYAGTTAPSLEVTVVGANHMSFLDDAASCGFTCSLCNEATAANAAVKTSPAPTWAPSTSATSRASPPTTPTSPAPRPRPATSSPA